MFVAVITPTINLPNVRFTGAGYATHHQHVAVRLRNRSADYVGGTALETVGADVPTMMATLFGTLMLANCTEMVLSHILHLARRIITPLVSDVVVMIIGLSPIQVLINRQCNPYLRVVSLVITMAAGYLLA